MTNRERVFGFLLAVTALLLVLPAGRNLFFAGGYRWAYVLTLSFCVSGASTPLVRELARRRGALDRPGGAEGRKIHDRPTALLGGVGVWLGIVVALLANSVWPTAWRRCSPRRRCSCCSRPATTSVRSVRRSSSPPS